MPDGYLDGGTVTVTYTLILVLRFLEFHLLVSWRSSSPIHKKFSVPVVFADALASDGFACATDILSTFHTGKIKHGSNDT